MKKNYEAVAVGFLANRKGSQIVGSLFSVLNEGGETNQRQVILPQTRVVNFNRLGNRLSLREIRSVTHQI